MFVIKKEASNFILRNIFSANVSVVVVAVAAVVVVAAAVVVVAAVVVAVVVVVAAVVVVVYSITLVHIQWQLSMKTRTLLNKKAINSSL